MPLFKLPCTVHAVGGQKLQKTFFLPAKITRKSRTHSVISPMKSTFFMVRQGIWYRNDATTALPGAGVPKKTVRSTNPALLNININMLVRDLALADLIKLLACLGGKHKLSLDLFLPRLTPL